MKNALLLFLALVLCLSLCLGLCACTGGGGGDGVTSCRNCGRKTNLVAGFGYCGTCYEGFVEWQKDNY